MELTQDIINKISEFRLIPKENFHQYIGIITRGSYKKWLNEAERLIDRGKPAITDEEILLLAFYKAIEINRLQIEVELLAVIEESSDPEAQKWLQERSDVVESTQKKFAELTEKFGLAAKIGI